VGVRRGFRLADLPVINQGLNPGVIMRQPFQVTIAEQIGAAVPDVCETEIAAVEQAPGECRAHALQGKIGLDQFRDLVIGLVDGKSQPRKHVLAGGGTLDLPDRVDRHGGREIAGGRATHPVGDHEQIWARISGVLVVLPDQSDIRMGDIAQLESHLITTPASASSCRCVRYRQA
jgi:hypothetical protein